MKSVIVTGLVAASLALTGNTAMAGTRHVHNTTAIHRHVARRGVGRMYYAHAPYYYLDVGQFIQGMLGGGPWPAFNLRLPHYARWTHGNGGTYVPMDSPTYDTSPPIDYGADARAAADFAQAQAMQQQLNDSMALTASMQAAAAQNAADTAATIQTEINAGM